MPKMFAGVRTWSPITGCSHRCPDGEGGTYCWAKRLVDTKLSKTPKYAESGFRPAIHRDVIKKGPPIANELFVTAMGDMWCRDVPYDWIREVMQCINRTTDFYNRVGTFMFLTKNPVRYLEWFVASEQLYNDKYLLGVTIETNRDTPITCHANAPNPFQRFRNMVMLKHEIGPRMFVSIEPVQDFDHDILPKWIGMIGPERVYIGYDNYRRFKIETTPSVDKVEALIKAIEGMQIPVFRKTMVPKVRV